MLLFPTTIAYAQAAQKAYPKAPTSVSLAQFGQESGWGTHMPVASNNPFGYKAVGDQPFVSSITREVVDGKVITITANFRKFDSLGDAFMEHARLLETAEPYESAREQLPNIEAYVTELAKHYATDPNYAHLILEIIHDGNLTQYDVG